MTSEPYRHIVISDDDELVIEAGMRGGTTASAAHVGASASSALSKDTASTKVHGGEKESTQAKSKGDEDVRPVKPKANDTYRATTAEDLKSSPMMGMQKVIIAVAVLGLVAFFVYFLFLR